MICFLQESGLTEMIHLVKDGFNKKTVQDCINYGIKLTQELEQFTETFLPHMQEEEEVIYSGQIFLHAGTRDSFG